MFRANHNRGFQMEFKNGVTISVQFGTGNYCERRNINAPIQSEMKMDRVESNTAEIAIWDKEGTWFNFGHDQVKGWVDVDEVARWITVCSEVVDIDHLRSKAMGWGMIEKVEQ